VRQPFAGHNTSAFDALVGLAERLTLAVPRAMLAREEAVALTPPNKPPAPPTPNPSRWRRGRMWAAFSALPLALVVGTFTLVKPLYTGKPWGTPLDYVEAFAVGFAAQASLTLLNALVAQVLSARRPLRGG
jgi:hypothetical protein